MKGREEILTGLESLDEMIRKINSTKTIDEVMFEEILTIWNKIVKDIFVITYHFGEARAALIQEMNTKHLKDQNNITQYSARILQILNELYKMVNIHKTNAYVIGIKCQQ